MIRLRFPDLARPGQLEVLRAIGTTPGASALSFGGGTALALVYFGHRISMDLDFFAGTRDDFKAGIQTVMTALRQLGHRFDHDFSDTKATMKVHWGEEKLKIDVLLDPLVANVPCEQLTDVGIRVLPLTTLAVLKAEAAQSREQLERLKDIFDLLTIDAAPGPGLLDLLPHEAGKVGRLLEALEQLDDLVPELPRLRPQRGLGENPHELVKRKNTLCAALLERLRTGNGS